MGAVTATGWCCTLISGFAVAFLSVLGMALNTGTDLLGEIDGNKADAASRCYYAAAVMLRVCDLVLTGSICAGVQLLLLCICGGGDVWW